MRSSFRRASLGTAFAALGIGLTTLAAHPAAAQTTTMVADDITPITGFTGQAVTGFSFTTSNFNAAATTFSPAIYFYSSDGASGRPGTLLFSGTFNPITQAASSTPGGGTTFLRSATSTTGFFALPSTTFWAGISFSGATAPELNNLGQGLLDPPTVGSSQDVAFQSAGPATTGGNPAGGFFNFGGSPNPAVNFGWSFRVGTNTVYSNTTNFFGQSFLNGGALAPVPEASTTVSLGLLLALGMGGLIVASKRKKASVQA